VFWVPKFLQKLGIFGVLFNKNGFSIRKQCLAAIEAISSLPGTVFHESIGSYRYFHLQLISYPETVLSLKSMPPKKAKDETNNSFKTPLEKSAFVQPVANSPAQIEIQQTKFEGILELSPVQQMSKDLEHAIEDNITSPNKSIHGSINHLKLRELMDVGREVNTQEEAIVEKLKSSILDDVKGMADEIISGITSAGYDILRDVFTETAPQL